MRLLLILLRAPGAAPVATATHVAAPDAATTDALGNAGAQLYGNAHAGAPPPDGFVETFMVDKKAGMEVRTMLLLLPSLVLSLLLILLMFLRLLLRLLLLLLLTRRRDWRRLTARKRATLMGRAAPSTRCL